MTVIGLLSRESHAFIELARQKGWNRPDILIISAAWECSRLIDPVSFDCKLKDE